MPTQLKQDISSFLTWSAYKKLAMSMTWRNHKHLVLAFLQGSPCGKWQHISFFSKHCGFSLPVIIVPLLCTRPFEAAVPSYSNSLHCYSWI